MEENAKGEIPDRQCHPFDEGHRSICKVDKPDHPVFVWTEQVIHQALQARRSAVLSVARVSSRFQVRFINLAGDLRADTVFHTICQQVEHSIGRKIRATYDRTENNAHCTVVLADAADPALRVAVRTFETTLGRSNSSRTLPYQVLILRRHDVSHTESGSTMGPPRVDGWLVAEVLSNSDFAETVLAAIEVAAYRHGHEDSLREDKEVVSHGSGLDSIITRTV